MSSKKRSVSKVATTDDAVVVPQEPVTNTETTKSEVVAVRLITYPCAVLLKNNTPRRIKESVTGVALMPHSTEKVVLTHENDFKQITNNFKQLNLQNQWTDGLQITHSLGGDDA